jgi:protein-L-isoaspartate(D-aspartate) O-methyltransferase
MLELLQPRSGDKILDVGSGSGWTTALLAEIVGEKGQVWALEIIPELKDFGEKNAEAYGFVSGGRAKFSVGDGSLGLKAKAPFNRILVSAAAAKVPPELLEQLKVGGRLVIPVGDSAGQEIQLITKDEKGQLEVEHFPGFIFVPLIS